MIYGIWCVVDGGRTGHREAWLKDEGVIKMWSDKAEAQAEADQMTRIMNKSFAKATFTYTVAER